MPAIAPLENGAPLTPAHDAAEAIQFSYTDSAGDAPIPIDPEQIARVYGVPVFEYDLPYGLSGYLDWDAQGAFIVVNRWNSPERRRFTVAHELGHYFDVFRRNLPRVKKDRGPLAAAGTDIDEIYANRFAASVLMPANAVRDKFRLTKDVGMLARLFQVSDQAMSVRLRNLKLI